MDNKVKRDEGYLLRLEGAYINYNCSAETFISSIQCNLCSMALWITLSFAAFLLQLHVSAAANVAYPQTYPSTVAPTTAATYKPTTAAPHCPQICPAGPVGPKGWTKNYALT